MNALGTLLGLLAKRRIDGMVAAVLVIGGMGFGGSGSLLQAEQDEAPKVLLAAQQAKLTVVPTTPRIDYLAEGNGPKVVARPFPLTKLMMPRSDGLEKTVGGDPGGPGATPVHFDGRQDQGLALGKGASVPQGGFGASAPGRSAGSVPEPSEWALIAMGIAMVAGMAWWSRNPSRIVA